MTLLDRSSRLRFDDREDREDRHDRDDRDDRGPALTPWQLRLRGAGAGSFAVGATFVALCLPVLLAWVASPDGTVGWGSALGVSSAAWLLGAGVHLVAAAPGAPPASLSVAPLLVTAGQLLVAAVSARHVLSRLCAGSGTRLSCGRLRRAVGNCAAGFVLAYALGGAVLAALASSAGVRAAPWAAFCCAALWALLAYGWAAGRLHGQELLSAGVVGRWRVPAYLGRSLAPAAAGVAGALTLGTLLVLGSVVAHLGRVTATSGALGGGVAGQLVLALAQLLVLPDLSVWALSWMAGPGFILAAGSSVTWAGAHPGMLPMVPVLAALPGAGRFPGWVAAAALGPACVGVGIAWLAQRRMSALTSWRLRAQVTGSACVLCALALTVLALLSSGSLGSARLGAVGPPALLTGAALLGEILVGSLLGGVVLGRRARRRVRERGAMTRLAAAVRSRATHAEPRI